MSTVLFLSDIQAQPAAPSNLDVWVEYGTPIKIIGTWECEPDSGFQFYVVKRDGFTIGTSLSMNITTNAPATAGTMCISVAAYYNHGMSNEVTDCVTWGASHISIEPNFHYAVLSPGDTLSRYVNIKNNGSTDLSYSFPGFDTGNPPPGFITSVTPASGVISPGAFSYIAIRWDANGYSYPGAEQDLTLNSSDATLPVSIIENTMTVMDHVYVQGHVYDILTGLPIRGARIGFYNLYPNTQPVQSLSDGSYIFMSGWSNTYPYIKVPCNKEAYNYSLDTILSGSLSPGDTVLMDIYLTPTPYPVEWVWAEVPLCSIPSQAQVYWSLPTGEEEIIYDDGIAEDCFAWTSANNENAVRITPSFYPAKLTGGSVYVGDGTYPEAYWLCREFAILVYEEGPGNMPGILLDSVGVLIYHDEWLRFEGLDAQIDSGDFFISMKQINTYPNTAPIGIDNTLPLEGRSYQRSAGGNWSLSAYQDFMIRAIVEGPSTLGGLTHYTISRISDFDPQAGPETGTHTPLGNTTTTSFDDAEFQFLPDGWYAYAVEASYSTGEKSPRTYSNIVGSSMGHTLTFIVSDCLLGPAEGFVVSAVGQDWPFESFIDTTDVNGICVFDCVWAGEWEFSISKCAYEDHEFIDIIDQDITYEIIMNNKRYKPRNLHVDSLTGIASWEEPMITALLDDFDDSDIYANGWQMTTNGTGWLQTENGTSSGFFIPPNGSTYVCVNDNAGGAGNDGCCDMLIAPELDLCESNDYVLSFDSYFTGVFGQAANVLYSIDTGQNWNLLFALSPAAGVWENIEIDLTAFSGVNANAGFMLAFHADDQGGVASGWAIDNVDIKAGSANASAYYTYLDGVYFATVDTTNYHYSGLSYGQTYVAGVAAFYDCGLSDEAYEVFTSGYLEPPSHFEGDSVGTNAELVWVYDTASITGVMPEVLGFNVYRDSIHIAFVPYAGQDTSYYTDTPPDPMCYDYQVSTVYDLTSFGSPGMTGESEFSGEEEVCILFGDYLPVFEDWSSGNFGTWTADDNWAINGQVGNEKPSASFTWDPIMANYSSSLMSGPINGIFGDTKSVNYIDGRFILRFDLKLEDVSASGNEHLSVEVWSDGAWNMVYQFDNIYGSFDWKTTEVDITSIALGHIFKVRFMANGQHSYDILSWFVDNISLERVCYPPYDLMIAPAAEDIISLCWRPPSTIAAVADTWIHWDNDTHVGGIGLSGGGTFSVASHWDEDMLMPYHGYSITKIRFVPGDQIVATDFTLKIWAGIDAGVLLYEELLSDLDYGEWNTLELSSPVEIDATQELWFGYTCVSADGDWPAGYDDGPSVVGYGDMISMDGVVWEPISSYGSQFDLNWNLRAFISEENDTGSISAREISNINLSNRQLTGYDIFWNENAGVGPYEYLDFTVDTFYDHYKDPPFIFGTLYTYKIVAVYEDCQAEHINTIIWEGLDEETKHAEIVMYPNPTSNSLHIQSFKKISSIQLINYNGLIIYDNNTPASSQVKIDMSSFDAGVYLIRVDSGKKSYTRKIVVAR